MVRSSVPLEDVVTAYRETGSVWRAGKRLGLAGQTVHERLRAAGHRLTNTAWDADELAEAGDLSQAGVPLGQIASRLGRTYASVATQLSRMGVRSGRKRERKLPRASGYDKESIRKRMKELESFKGPITRFARVNGLNVESLVRAIQRDNMEWWKRYLNTHSDIPSRDCPYCHSLFIPASGKQIYCDRKCAQDARADRAYFGGQRRTTVGLAEGVCQLCQRQVDKGLSSHHVFGKENDPDNLVLVALCQGCHQLITLLGNRPFVDDPVVWQTLISLAWLRRHGAEFGAGGSEGSLYVEVDIELWPTEEGEE